MAGRGSRPARPLMSRPFAPEMASSLIIPEVCPVSELKLAPGMCRSG